MTYLKKCFFLLFFVIPFLPLFSARAQTGSCPSGYLPHGEVCCNPNIETPGSFATGRDVCIKKTSPPPEKLCQKKPGESPGIWCNQRDTCGYGSYVGFRFDLCITPPPIGVCNKEVRNIWGTVITPATPGYIGSIYDYLGNEVNICCNPTTEEAGPQGAKYNAYYCQPKIVNGQIMPPAPPLHPYPRLSCTSGTGSSGTGENWCCPAGQAAKVHPRGTPYCALVPPALQLLLPLPNTTVSGLVNIQLKLLGKAGVGVFLKPIDGGTPQLIKGFSYDDGVEDSSSNSDPAYRLRAYSFNWDSVTVADGSYQILAVATDVLGNKTNSNPYAILVNINNTYDCTDTRFEPRHDVRLRDYGNQVLVCAPGIFTGCLPYDRFPNNYDPLITGPHHIFYEGANNERGVVVCSREGEEPVSFGPFKYSKNPDVKPWVRRSITSTLPTGGLPGPGTKYKTPSGGGSGGTTTDTAGPSLDLQASPSPWTAASEVKLTATANDPSGVGYAKLNVGTSFPHTCSSIGQPITLDCSKSVQPTDLPVGQTVTVAAVDLTSSHNLSLGLWKVITAGTLSSGRQIGNAFVLSYVSSAPTLGEPTCPLADLQRMASLQQELSDIDQWLTDNPLNLFTLGLRFLAGLRQNAVQTDLANLQNSCQPATANPNSSTNTDSRGQTKTTCFTNRGSPSGALPSSFSGLSPDLLNQILAGACR